MSLSSILHTVYMFFIFITSILGMLKRAVPQRDNRRFQFDFDTDRRASGHIYLLAENG